MILTIVAFVFISGLSGNSNMCYVGLFPSRYDKTNQTGIVCGLIDALIYLGSAVFSLIMGYVVDRFPVPQLRPAPRSRLSCILVHLRLRLVSMELV